MPRPLRVRRSATLALLLAGLALPACGDKADDDEACEPTDAPADRCNGVDDDCDGLVDEDAVSTPDWYADLDGDGYGAGPSLGASCEPIEGAVDNDLDCDDEDADRSPEAEETCNGIDDDCDGLVDDADGSAEADVLAYVDGDGDGYGAGPAMSFCSLPEGFSEKGGDCDDQDAGVSPGEEEVCDDEGTDEDCDGLVNNDDPELDATVEWYPDSDGDGFGEDAGLVETCTPPSDYVAEGGDCDDSDRFVNPDQPETCNNGIDDDCDGGNNGCRPVDGEVAFARAPQQITGSYSYLGQFMSSGELTGTGSPDLVVGDHGAGRIYIFAELSDGTDRTTSGATSRILGDDYLGYYLDSGVDLSGDGTDDVLTWSEEGPLVFEGPLLGTFAASAASAGVKTESTWLNSFGDPLTALDLSGDGQADLVMAEPDNEVVYVFEGPLDGGTLAVDEAWLTLEGTTTSTYPGARVLSAGDVDGDGLDDLVVADYWGANAGATTGEVWLLTGSSAAAGRASLDDVDLHLPGSASGAYHGYSAAGGVDLDGDGYDDLAVGAPNDSSVGDGLVTVYSGTADLDSLGTPTALLAHSGSTNFFAYDLALSEDLDDDGHGEIIVGHLGYSESASNAGAAYVFYGPHAGTLDQDDAGGIVQGESSSDYLGTGLYAGDLDGDGVSDLALSGYNVEQVSIWTGGGY